MKIKLSPARELKFDDLSHHALRLLHCMIVLTFACFQLTDWYLDGVLRPKTLRKNRTHLKLRVTKCQKNRRTVQSWKTARTTDNFDEFLKALFQKMTFVCIKKSSIASRMEKKQRKKYDFQKF